MLQLPRVGIEALVARAREEEDLVRDRLRKHRREGFRTWCRAGTEGSMKALFRWVREGPRSLQSMGVHLKEVFAGQAALLLASEEVGGHCGSRPKGLAGHGLPRPRACQVGGPAILRPRSCRT